MELVIKYYADFGVFKTYEGYLNKRADLYLYNNELRYSQKFQDRLLDDIIQDINDRNALANYKIHRKGVIEENSIKGTNKDKNYIEYPHKIDVVNTDTGKDVTIYIKPVLRIDNNYINVQLDGYLK